ncbi:MAG: D-alanine--D-alanine ligase [Flavobacteriia bacterium]|nr:MAG: D-alanine--D-alanine ligase [Flavobacteriia bacterium]
MPINIAVVMGGYSSEYQISLKSGAVVCKHLDSPKYQVFPIHILKDKWVYVSDDKHEYPVNRSDFSIDVDGMHITFDAVFNAIHGHPGEDGVLLAYFELLGIPHTSDHFYKMALTFNKRDCLSVLDAYNIPHATSYYLNKGDNIDINDIIQKTGLPCFVKANRAGSSFGVSKVKEKSKLIETINYAFEEDDEVLIEEFLNGTEVSVGVITYKGEIRVLPLTEIVSENEFFDFEAKYLGQSQEITPARLSDEETEKVRHLAKKTYKALGMKGITRSEYIFKNGIPHLLEVNTVPGLTEASILPQQARHEGISLAELFGDMIENTLHKKRR